MSEENDRQSENHLFRSVTEKPARAFSIGHALMMVFAAAITYGLLHLLPADHRRCMYFGLLIGAGVGVMGFLIARRYERQRLAFGILLGCIGAGGLAGIIYYAIPTSFKAIPFAPPNAGFEIAFPGRPNESQQVLQLAAGPITMYVYTYEARDRAYACMYSDFKEIPGGPDISLDNAREGILSNSGSRLVSEKKIQLNGYPGREIELISRQELPFTMRLYVVENRLYQLGVFEKRGRKDNDVLEKFFGSFRLTSHPMAGLTKRCSGPVRGTAAHQGAELAFVDVTQRLYPAAERWR